MKTRIHPCPICHEPVDWDRQSETRPFCSERCRLIDLGEWFDESRRIPGEPATIPDDGHDGEIR